MRYAPFLCLTLFLLPAGLAAQALRVASHLPGRNAVSAEREAPLVIDFDRPVDPATLNAASLMIFGRWSGVMPGEVQLAENNTRVLFVPARPFSAGEMVTVSVARHVATADGTTLGRGYAWQFWTRTRPATLNLAETGRLSVRRPGENHIQTYGAYAGDLNGDGYTDFAVPNERANDIRVFMNDGTGDFGAFTVYPIPGGTVPSTNEGADFNLDGHLDFAVGNSQGDAVSVFMGDGTGHLASPVNYPADDGVRGLAVLDLNGDGYPDLATANRDAGNVSVLLNDGDGSFTRMQNADAQGQGETAATTADLNEDGLLDLIVGSFTSEEMSVLLGDGDGGLTFHTKVSAGGASWMVASGDVNNDGHVDVVSANSRDNTASVLFGDGQGNLSAPAAYPTGSFSLAIDLGDLDGDGDLDLVTSNFNGNDWTIYENLGDGTFGSRRNLPAGQAGSCAVLHDRNNDGALDMTGIDELDDLLFLFTNTPVPTTTEPTPEAGAAALMPAFPNPFRLRTTLTFHLREAGRVHVALYDLLGRSVRTLIDASYPQGTHTLTWDGRNDAGLRLPDGVYAYRLQAGSTVRTRTLLYVK